ncbi:MAG: LytTR family DNA-binding domain-containing protein [Ferruginibacter sp.]
METINQQINHKGQLTLQTSDGKLFFLPEQIVRLEARSNYTKIFFVNRPSMLLAKVLKDFELPLIPFGFLRTHRSHLINKKFIHTINNMGEIIMEDASVAIISRRKKNSVVKSFLNQDS